MWGIAIRFRASRRLAITGLLLTLSACATHRSAPMAAADPAPAPRVAGERDATGAYRFNMTQDGRRMSADEFDAWMKARGIRVAKGAPAAGHSSRTAAQATQGKAKPARPVAPKAAAQVATAKAAAAVKPTAAAKPTTVAQAGKPKAKAKEVSAAKGPAKQGTGEG